MNGCYPMVAGWSAVLSARLGFGYRIARYD
jgi:hypothetical protein